MNMHVEEPDLSVIWKRSSRFDRQRFVVLCFGLCLITTGITMMLGLAGFLVCAGVGFVLGACVAE